MREYAEVVFAFFGGPAETLPAVICLLILLAAARTARDMREGG